MSDPSLSDSQHAVPDSRHSTPSGLTSLWIEIPPFCHLHCSYCYTSANRDMQVAPDGMLSVKEYKDLINEFADMGGKEVGIPGRGEPFHPRNEPLVRELIDTAFSRGVTTMLFTTGETLFYTKEGKKETPYVRRADDELIRFLISRKVLLFVKYNSRKPEVQDALVDMEGYTVRRNEALDALISTYRLPESGKLGVATSYMDANENEILEIYEFAKRNNLVFDCDTVLPQGRGWQYVKESTITEDKYLALCKELRRRENVTLHPGGTYITSSCDRIKRHLYIDYRGDGYPCLGAWRKILLGNIRNMSLHEMWNTEPRRQLREHRHSVFTAVCAQCDNFLSDECNSCLSRAVEEVRIDHDKGTMELITRGCINHRPHWEYWLAAVKAYLNATLARPEVRDMLLQKGLSSLWSADRNITYLLSCFPPDRRKNILAAFGNRQRTADEALRSARVADSEFGHGIDELKKFSRKDAYDLDAMRFSMNKVWKFIAAHEEGGMAQDIAVVFPGDVLANVMLPSVKIALNGYPEGNKLFLQFQFSTYRENTRFCRKFVKHCSETDSLRLSLAQQWAEYSGISPRGEFEISTTSQQPASTVFPTKGNQWNIKAFTDMPLVKEKIRKMHMILEKSNISLQDGHAPGGLYAALDENACEGLDDDNDHMRRLRQALALPVAGNDLPQLPAVVKFLVWAGYICYFCGMTRYYAVQYPSGNSKLLPNGYGIWTDAELTDDAKEMMRALLVTITESLNNARIK